MSDLLYIRLPRTADTVSEGTVLEGDQPRGSFTRAARMLNNSKKDAKVCVYGRYSRVHRVDGDDPGPR